MNYDRTNKNKKKRKKRRRSNKLEVERSFPFSFAHSAFALIVKFRMLKVWLYLASPISRSLSPLLSLSFVPSQLAIMIFWPEGGTLRGGPRSYPITLKTIVLSADSPPWREPYTFHVQAFSLSLSCCSIIYPFQITRHRPFFIIIF